MIWRLMAMVLVTSDTGSVSLVATHTDWPTEQQCREIIASHYQPPPPKEINGHVITAKIGASCVPVQGGLPPVVASDQPVGAPVWRPRPPAPPPPPGFREFFGR